MVGTPVILVNRIGEDLEFTADGQHHILTPGDNYGFVEPHAFYAMKQNPLMGSEDYYTTEFRSLIGVKERDGKERSDCPCGPISDDDLLQAMDAIERFNRDDAGLRPTIVVKPRHRMPRGRTGEVTTGASGNAMAIGG